MVSLNDYMLQCIYAAHDTAENIYDIIKKSLKLDFIVAWSRAAYENQTMKQKNIDCVSINLHSTVKSIWKIGFGRFWQYYIYADILRANFTQVVKIGLKL